MHKITFLVIKHIPSHILLQIREKELCFYGGFPFFVVYLNWEMKLVHQWNQESPKGKKKEKEKKLDKPSSLTWGLVKITASLWRVGCGRCRIWWIKDLLFSAKRLLACRRKERVFGDARQAGGHHLEPFWFGADAGDGGVGRRARLLRKGAEDDAASAGWV